MYRLYELPIPINIFISKLTLFVQRDSKYIVLRLYLVVYLRGILISKCQVRNIVPLITKRRISNVAVLS